MSGTLDLMDGARLSHVLSPDYTGDVRALPMEELRSRRTDCQEMEVALSYQRRMAQGRLDLVAAERRRRETGEAPVSHDDLVAQLSGILADRTRSSGVGRLPQFMTPDADEVDTSELDALVGPALLTSLPERSEEELAGLLEAVSAFEVDVSSQRRLLHERIDALQAEITRRYKDGEASVESLLK